ncbi:hypothetical protein BH11PSE11_BH11PSE11_24200 [soil metagenome]
MNTMRSMLDDGFIPSDDGATEVITLATVELDFHFEHEQEVFAPLPVISDYCGPIPRAQEIVIFGGSERVALAFAGLPSEVWQVHQVTFEFLDQVTRRVSVSLVNVTSEYQRGGSLIH